MHQPLQHQPERQRCNCKYAGSISRTNLVDTGNCNHSADLSTAYSYKLAFLASGHSQDFTSRQLKTRFFVICTSHMFFHHEFIAIHSLPSSLLAHSQIGGDVVFLGVTEKIQQVLYRPLARDICLRKEA